MNTGRIIKPNGLRLYSMLVPTFRPQNVKAEPEVGPDACSYDYVQPAKHEATPAFARLALHTARKWIHSLPAPATPDPVGYERYIQQYEPSFSLAGITSKARTCMVHGDLTLENVLAVTTQRTPTFVFTDAVFIDPGNARGLYWKELDEAKLLQSLACQWEAATRPGWPVFPYPLDRWFLAQPMHLMLLWSHWIRLRRHKQKQYPEYVAFVEKEIRRELQETDLCGRRWSPHRLQRVCVEWVLERNRQSASGAAPSGA